MKKYSKSIDLFVKELKSRLDLLNQNDNYKTTNSDDFKEYNSVLSKYGIESPEKITDKDIKKIDKKDLLKLLLLIGLDEENSQKIVDDYLEHHDSAFIIDNIIRFYQDYIKVSNTQNEMYTSKVLEYEKYIKLLTDEEQGEIFTNFDEINNLMGLFAIDKSDRWLILEFLAKRNLKLKKNTIEDINLDRTVGEIISTYLKEENDLVIFLKKYIDTNVIDIDLLPTIASNIATSSGFEKNQVQDTLASLIIGGLYQKYQELTSSQEKDEIRVMILEILEYITPIQNEIVGKARLIINQTQEFYVNSYQESESEVLKYIDDSIIDMIDAGISSDEAIDLKSLPIIKTIAETLDKVDRLNPYEDDFMVCCDILEELIEAYDNLLSKKGEYRKLK